MDTVPNLIKYIYIYIKTYKVYFTYMYVLKLSYV